MIGYKEHITGAQQLVRFRSMMRSAALFSAILAFSLFPLAVMLLLFGQCAAFFLLMVWRR